MNIKNNKFTNIANEFNYFNIYCQMYSININNLNFTATVSYFKPYWQTNVTIL
jgi:hypothetical protein